MEIELIGFGKIAEIIGSQKILIGDVTDTEQLNDFLQQRFPELRNIKYKLAMNKQLVQKNIRVISNATIAVMPPFSGG